MYPSEYAYRDDSVTRTEKKTVVICESYSEMKDNIHCYNNGPREQLKLSDSDRGSNTEYTPDSYYVWSDGSDGQLLFIFPTRVSLTTITLHYYSDSVRGLPQLRLYAVSDDFDVWDALISVNPHDIKEVASVSSGGEPARRRSISVNVNFNTSRILMYKFRSTFMFAVSEVEFFRCSKKIFTN